MSLAERVYAVTRDFPSNEQFGLTSQLRRAVVSIASNIAEGHGRGSKPDFCRFLKMALGSAREAETQIILASRLEFADKESLCALLRDVEEVSSIIQGLIRSQRT